MSNLINSLNLQLNASKGYNPYRNADGTFANGPAAFYHSTFVKFADRGGSGKGAKEEVKDTLDGMLRLGTNLKSVNNPQEYVSQTASKTGGHTNMTEALSEMETDSLRKIGETLTINYNKVAKKINNVMKNPTDTAVKSLQKEVSGFADHAKSLRGEGKSVFYNVMGEIFNSYAALANTTIALNKKEEKGGTLYGGGKYS